MPKALAEAAVSQTRVSVTLPGNPSPAPRRRPLGRGDEGCPHGGRLCTRRRAWQNGAGQRPL